MGKQVGTYFGKGLSAAQFVAGMTQNKEAFEQWLDAFQWENEEAAEFFASFRFRDDVRCLILAADWCGDVVKNVPVLFKALEATEMPVEVMIQEDHPDLMDQFLTMGGRAIPVAIFADTGGHVLGTWGPRPAHVQAIMTRFKTENPDREAPDYQEKIRVAYGEMAAAYGEGTGYQHVIVRELQELLSRF